MTSPVQKKTLGVITGASRGFGLSFALTLSNRLADNLHLHLLSRSPPPPTLTDALSSNGTTFHHHKIDLADLDQLATHITVSEGRRESWREESWREEEEEGGGGGSCRLFR